MSDVATYEIAPGYTISRVIRGGWQLAGGHGAIDRAMAIEDLTAAFDAGIFTYDSADIYTGVEVLYGAFRAQILRSRGSAAAGRIRVHTKFVPDLERLASLARSDIETVVDRSLHRLQTDRLDLVQFHWWDYAQPRWLEALHWLDRLLAKGKISHIGATNFDTPHVAAIIDAGIPLVSLQVQYSALDRRPQNGLAALCAKHAIALLCYGSVAGGFLSDRWLGAPEPADPVGNRSLVKYKLIIDDFGGWALFQELLAALRSVADRHQADIATIASAYVLAKPGVAAVIVGARNRAHAGANANAAKLVLTTQDLAAIASVVARARGPLGDVYALERDRDGRHGSIMKYNLNAKAS